MLEKRVSDVAERLDHDATHLDDAWQISRDEAMALHQIIVAARCRSILEIGVSYGFSTLHLGCAARITGGHVHAIDASEKKFNAATANLAEAGLSEYVTVHLGTAQEIGPKLWEEGAIEAIDFAFIDAVKKESFEYLEAIRPALSQRAILAVDNALTHAVELESFILHLRALPETISSELIAIGNGFELTILERDRRPGFRCRF